jgi:hypothetical protein
VELEKNLMNKLKIGFFNSFLAVAFGLLITSNALAAVSFVSASSTATLVKTIDQDNERVFVFGGIASGESTTLTFSTDSTCPGIAMTGGAEFTTNWNCAAGAISATVTNRGGMSFGPSPEGNQGTFYVTFSDPPTPPGMSSPAAMLSGIQISVFGDVSSWNLSGDANASGATFGVYLSGTQGGEAHFRMDLPKTAVQFLGGVLGLYVGGKPDPFATVINNNDGSAEVAVDIKELQPEASRPAELAAMAKPLMVSKKITTGTRSLSVAFSATSVKAGKSASLAMCSGAAFVAGDKVPVKLTLGSKSLPIKKSFTLNATGCGVTSIKLKSVTPGSLTAKVSYKGQKAKATLKVIK